MKRWITALTAMTALSAPAFGSAAEEAWVTESNRHSEALLEAIAKHIPEEASAYGVESHDGDVFDLKPGHTERYLNDLQATADALAKARETTTDPRVRQDIDILIGAARDRITTQRLNDRLMQPYSDLPKSLFFSFHQLLDERLPKKRQEAALVRLRRYAGTERGYEAVTILTRAEYESAVKNNHALVGPWVVEVEQSLQNQQRYVDGIRDLFKQRGIKGWQKDFNTFARQVDDYGKWVRTEVLPRARKTNQLPPEIYADNLKNYGVHMDPHEIMDRALAAFVQTRDEMSSMAKVVAERHHWQASDYLSVIRELKKDRIPQDKLLELYTSRLRAIEGIARDEHLITLPKRDAIIRLATEAESAATPAPHVDIPRLIGNTGEPPTFVLNTSNPNAKSGEELNDFNYDAISWALTAHEARPGHELQFSSIIEQGVSVARAVFALNSANAEGWGLYSEAIVKNYVPLEGQLGILQMRLLRAARAFLDPMLNLGMIEPDAAKRILLEQVGCSEPMAKQEVDRYTFDSPGQATSYFYGYSKLSALREKVEIALKGRFTQQAYHDFIVKAGLLPLDLLEKSVMDDFVPSRGALPAQ